MNDNDKPVSETKSERLEREITELELELKESIEAEEMARKAQHWIKKRIKLANLELAELVK